MKKPATGGGLRVLASLPIASNPEKLVLKTIPENSWLNIRNMYFSKADCIMINCFFINNFPNNSELIMSCQNPRRHKGWYVFCVGFEQLKKCYNQYSVHYQKTHHEVKNRTVNVENFYSNQNISVGGSALLPFLFWKGGDLK